MSSSSRGSFIALDSSSQNERTRWRRLVENIGLALLRHELAPARRLLLAFGSLQVNLGERDPALARDSVEQEDSSVFLVDGRIA